MIKQWDIFWADLNPVIWSEQSWIRPVLVLQKTELNEIFNTVFIAPITSNLESKWYMLTHYIWKAESWLIKDSVVLVFQARCISKLRLTRKIWELTNSDLELVKKELNKLI